MDSFFKKNIGQEKNLNATCMDCLEIHCCNPDIFLLDKGIMIIAAIKLFVAESLPHLLGETYVLIWSLYSQFSDLYLMQSEIHRMGKIKLG